MMDNNTFEKALDLIIDEAVNNVNQEECERLANVPHVSFSKEHEEKMRKIFKKANNARIKAGFFVYAKRVACILLVCIVLASISICSVKAWRIQFLNLFFNEDAPNSKFNTNADAGTHYNDENVSLEYIPGGFEVVSNNVTRKGVSLYFEKDDLFLEVSIIHLPVQGTVDTEDATISTIDINGYEATLIEKADLNQVLWTDDTDYYYICGNLSSTEIVKIAKNLKKI